MTLKTWGGTTDIWNNPSAWVPQSVPSFGDDAILGGTGSYTVTVPTFGPLVNSLTIDNPNAILQIGSNGGVVAVSTIEVVSGSIAVQPHQLANSVFNISIQSGNQPYSDSKFIADTGLDLNNALFLFTGIFNTWEMTEAGAGTLTLGSEFEMFFGGGSGSFSSDSGAIVNNGTIDGRTTGEYSTKETNGNYAVYITIDANIFQNNGYIYIGSSSVDTDYGITHVGTSSINSAHFSNTGLISVSAGVIAHP